jgi:hypothetical protein
VVRIAQSGDGAAVRLRGVSAGESRLAVIFAAADRLVPKRGELFRRQLDVANPKAY